MTWEARSKITFSEILFLHSLVFISYQNVLKRQFVFFDCVKIVAILANFVTLNRFPQIYLHKKIKNQIKCHVLIDIHLYRKVYFTKMYEVKLKLNSDSQYERSFCQRSGTGFHYSCLIFHYFCFIIFVYSCFLLCLCWCQTKDFDENYQNHHFYRGKRLRSFWQSS